MVDVVSIDEHRSAEKARRGQVRRSDHEKSER